MYLLFQQFLLPLVFSASQAESSSRSEGINSNQNPRVNIPKELCKMCCLGSQCAHWEYSWKANTFLIIVIILKTTFLTAFAQLWATLFSCLHMCDPLEVSKAAEKDLVPLFLPHREALSHSWCEVSSLQLTISCLGLRLWSWTTKVSGSFALQFNLMTAARLNPSFSNSYCWEVFLWHHTAI